MTAADENMIATETGTHRVVYDDDRGPVVVWSVSADGAPPVRTVASLPPDVAFRVAAHMATQAAEAMRRSVSEQQPAVDSAQHLQIGLTYGPMGDLRIKLVDKRDDRWLLDLSRVDAGWLIEKLAATTHSIDTHPEFRR